MRSKVAALALFAALVSACSSSLASPDPEHDARILVTVPGTWQTLALGGTLVITLAVGPLDPGSHTAPITGSGTLLQNQFAVTGTLGGKTKLGIDELGIVQLNWTMPYQGSAKPFTFSGGLADMQYSAFSQISGTLATTGTSVALILDRR